MITQLQASIREPAVIALHCCLSQGCALLSCCLTFSWPTCPGASGFAVLGWNHIPPMILCPQLKAGRPGSMLTDSVHNGKDVTW